MLLGIETESDFYSCAMKCKLARLLAIASNVRLRFVDIVCAHGPMPIVIVLKDLNIHDELREHTANICNLHALQWVETKHITMLFVFSKISNQLFKSNSLANLYVILTYANKKKNEFLSSMRINLCMWRHLVSFGYDFMITAIRGTVSSPVFTVFRIYLHVTLYMCFSLLLCFSWCALHIDVAKLVASALFL